METTIRFASNDIDRAAVYRMRYELYVEGQGLFADEADHQRRWLTDEDDAHSRLLLAERGGELVGSMRINWGRDAAFSGYWRSSYQMDRFCGIVDERDMIVGTRLVLLPEFRGGDLTCRLLCEMYRFAAQHGVTLILGNCEPHFVTYYYKLGFQPYGHLHNHETNGILVPVMMVVSDFEHLRRTRSPVLAMDCARAAARSDGARLTRACKQGAAVVCEVAIGSDEFLAQVISLCDLGQLGSLPRQLTDGERRELIARGLLIQCRPQDMLIGKNHTSRTMYVLLAGSLLVSDGQRTVARVTRSGSTVGEVECLSARRRMNGVVAGPEGAHVLALNNRTIRTIIAQRSPLAAQLLHFIALGLCDKLEELASAA